MTVAAAFLLGLAGLGLGVFFFGGLWWTVRRGLASKHAGLWFAASSAVRLAAVMAGMYWCTGGRWEKLLPCLLGFFIARFVVTRIAGTPLASVSPAAAKEKEDVNASDS